MNVRSWLNRSEKTLRDHDVMTARLDCLVLLEDLLGKDRAHLLAHPELELTPEQEKVLNKQVARRANHEPLAYIRQKVEFYGREFYVDERVLVPRPETETMIDLLKTLKPLVIVDVGTGSGAIAITAKKLFPKEVIAIDNDPSCLAVARKNAQTHKVSIAFKENNLMEGMAIPPGMVVLANLPYVPNDFTINKAALNEPHQAIFGGEDGLDLYRELFAQITQQKTKPSHILTESLPPQHDELAKIAQKHGYTLTKTSDFIQLFTYI